MPREIFGQRVFAAFILASALFLALFFLAYGVAYWNYQILSEQTNLLRTSIKELDSILGGFSCENSLLLSSSDVFGESALMLNLLEKRFGKRDMRVLEQKKLYSELQYRHLEITRQFNERCGENFTTILFFYSNKNERVEDQSERVGFILTSFERYDPARIMIYSFDVDLDSVFVQDLMKNHNVQDVPTAVVNDEPPVFIAHLSDLLSRNLTENRAF